MVVFEWYDCYLQCGAVITRSIFSKFLTIDPLISPLYLGCLLWLQIPFYVLPQQIENCMWYHIVLDCVTTALDCITTEWLLSNCCLFVAMIWVIVYVPSRQWPWNVYLRMALWRHMASTIWVNIGWGNHVLSDNTELLPERMLNY